MNPVVQMYIRVEKNYCMEDTVGNWEDQTVRRDNGNGNGELCITTVYKNETKID